MKREMEENNFFKFIASMILHDRKVSAFMFLHKLAQLIYQYLLALNKMSHIEKR